MSRSPRSACLALLAVLGLAALAVLLFVVGAIMNQPVGTPV